MWNQLTDEQKEAYGEDYFESAIRSLEKYTKLVSTENFFISCNESQLNSNY